MTILRQRNNGWARIEPPKGTIVWVHQDYIKSADEANDEAVEDSSSTTGDGHTNLKEVGIAEPVERIGFVIPLGARQGPWEYALAVRVNEKYYPVAYLKQDAEELQKWEWQRVVMTGTHQWFQGWPRPQIEVESVQPVSDAAKATIPSLQQDPEKTVRQAPKPTPQP